MTSSSLSFSKSEVADSPSSLGCTSAVSASCTALAASAACASRFFLPCTFFRL
jgi:hypothetical protein